MDMRVLCLLSLGYCFAAGAGDQYLIGIGTLLYFPGILVMVLLQAFAARSASMNIVRGKYVLDCNHLVLSCYTFQARPTSPDQLQM